MSSSGERERERERRTSAAMEKRKKWNLPLRDVTVMVPVTPPPLRVHLFEHQAQLGGGCTPGRGLEKFWDCWAAGEDSVGTAGGMTGVAGARTATEGCTDAGAEAE